MSRCREYNHNNPSSQQPSRHTDRILSHPHTLIPTYTHTHTLLVRQGGGQGGRVEGVPRTPLAIQLLLQVRTLCIQRPTYTLFKPTLYDI
jgi:hypothetical protein